jgi:hypothetical protein
LNNESTADIRKEGLRVLKKFFMSTQATNYPPGNIEVLDVTKETPAVMEKYFLDDDIEEILKAVLDREQELTEDFYEKYTEIAETIYLEKEPSDYAQTILGFPSLTAD